MSKQVTLGSEARKKLTEGINKFICSLDFHKWKYHENDFSRTCNRCNQYQIKYGNIHLTGYGLEYIWNWCNFQTWKN